MMSVPVPNTYAPTITGAFVMITAIFGKYEADLGIFNGNYISRAFSGTLPIPQGIGFEGHFSYFI